MATTRLKIDKFGQLSGHKGSIYTIIPGSSSGKFITAGGDGYVIEWEFRQQQNARLLVKVPIHIFSLLLLPDNDRLLIGQMEGGIHLIDLLQKKELRNIRFHKGGIFDIIADVSRRRIYVAGGDGVLSVWSYDDIQLIESVKISPSNLRCIDCHPHSNEMAIGSSDNHIYILDRESLKLKQILKHHANSVFSVRYHPSGEWLISGARDAYFVVWKKQNGYKPYKAIPAHLFTINSIVFNPDNQLFATASRDKTIKIWNAENFELLKVIDKEKLDGHRNSVNKLLWRNNDALLISISDDRMVMGWKIDY